MVFIEGMFCGPTMILKTHGSFHTKTIIIIISAINSLGPLRRAHSPLGPSQPSVRSLLAGLLRGRPTCTGPIYLLFIYLSSSINICPSSLCKGKLRMPWMVPQFTYIINSHVMVLYNYMINATPLTLDKCDNIHYQFKI